MEDAKGKETEQSHGLDALFAGYTGDYVPEEYDFGPDVGREILPPRSGQEESAGD